LKKGVKLWKSKLVSKIVSNVPYILFDKKEKQQKLSLDRTAVYAYTKIRGSFKRFKGIGSDKGKPRAIGGRKIHGPVAIKVNRVAGSPEPQSRFGHLRM